MWQDYVISAGQITFIIALLPSLLSDDKPHRTTCVLTGTVLAFFAFTFSTLSLWIGAITAGVCALCWYVLAAQERAMLRHYSVRSSLDTQQGGDHYKGRGIQPVEYIHVNSVSFNCGSAIKYCTRHKDKGKEVDLKKAVHFLQFELEQVYGIRSQIEYDAGKK